MIVHSKPLLWDVLFALRGSILPRIVGRLVFLGALSVAAILYANGHPAVFTRIGAIPFTLVGLALSIFMSFRNNACYERWWDARKLWGQLIITCRTLARQVSALEQADRQIVLHDLCAFTAGLVERLRGGDEVAAIDRWSTARDWSLAPNPTDAVLQHLGRHCLDLVKAGAITDIHHSLLETQLSSLSLVQASCERIATTPLPFAYSLLLHRTASIFCLTLPFALAGTLGWWTLLPVLLISYTFFGLDALGDQLEDPFGTEPNDLPLLAMCRTVEREMLAALGETDLPEALVAHNGILL